MPEVLKFEEHLCHSVPEEHLTPRLVKGISRNTNYPVYGPDLSTNWVLRFRHEIQIGRVMAQPYVRPFTSLIPAEMENTTTAEGRPVENGHIDVHTCGA